MAGGGQILRTTGLREFAKACKAAGEAAEAELRALNFEIGQRLLGAVQSAASGQGPAGARAAETSLASRAADRAVVTFGRNRPFWWGWAFGSRHDITRQGPGGRRYVGHNQFPARTKAGFWPYPQIAEHRSQLAAEYMARLDHIHQRIVATATTADT